MTVRPTTSGQTPRPGINRTGMPAAPSAPSRTSDNNATPAVAGVRRDDVQISAEARGLQQMDGAARGTAGELAPERLREVLSRVTSGHYDQPHVRDAVLGKLAKDL